MMALLYKELRLAAHPTSIVFAFLGCLGPGAGLSVQRHLSVRLLGALHHLCECAGNQRPLVHSRSAGDQTGKRAGEMPARGVLSALSTALLSPLCPFAECPGRSPTTPSGWTRLLRGMGLGCSYTRCSILSFSPHFIGAATRWESPFSGRLSRWSSSWRPQKPLLTSRRWLGWTAASQSICSGSCQS